jgi:aminopeptidase N
LVLDQYERTFVFEDVASSPVPSLLRGFSAPVVLDDGLSDHELLLLLRHDNDPFNQWEAGQRLALDRILSALKAGQPLLLDAAFLDAMRTVLNHPGLDPAFKALMLALPDEGYVAEQLTVVDPQAIHAAVTAARQQLAGALRADLACAYESHRTQGQDTQDVHPAGRRALSNMALSMLVLDAQANGDPSWHQRAFRQFEGSSNMTDRLGALAALVNAHSGLAAQALELFYVMHREDPLVVDKWFSLQVSACESDGRVFARTLALLQHPDFNIGNPNRARSVLGSLFLSNPGAFHRLDGAGYEVWVEQLIAIDAINAHVAARLARGMNRWASLAEPYHSAARRALLAAADADLSVGVRELVTQMLSSVSAPG